MPIFRRNLSIWEKVICVILLAMLGIVGVCIAMLEYLNLPATTKDLLETIAVRAFVLWWVGVVVLALYTVVRYRRPQKADQRTTRALEFLFWWLPVFWTSFSGIR